ncbi:hypothetical protein MA16_Dca026229 [Dendrobium catenatum]|uniref:Uncharacterized protein n=1 Tax=Dendrobium catenatum TaxID=906689 RepID=A0A2I0VD45_9ASPA|nr:hypothetical protein MA16_Dca026229 [Dendrobium catenatum]
MECLLREHWNISYLLKRIFLTLFVLKVPLLKVMDPKGNILEICPRCLFWFLFHDLIAFYYNCEDVGSCPEGGGCGRCHPSGETVEYGACVDDGATGGPTSVSVKESASAAATTVSYQWPWVGKTDGLASPSMQTMYVFRLVFSEVEMVGEERKRVRPETET